MMLCEYPIPMLLKLALAGVGSVWNQTICVGESLADRKCHFVATVAGKENMQEIEFHFPRDKAPQGGIVEKEFDNTKQVPGRKQHRYTQSLLSIFRRFQVSRIIGYFSLDVKGAEEWIMSGFPFSQGCFNVLTVVRPSKALANTIDK